MRESFSGFKSPTVIAAGRLHMAHGGALAWMDAHPGFTAVLVDNAAGDVTVALATDVTTGLPNLTSYTAVVLGTSATAQLFVSTSRPSTTTIRVRAMTDAGVLTDGDISLIVLCV